MTPPAKYRGKWGFTLLALGALLLWQRERLAELPRALLAVSPRALLLSAALNIMGSIILPAAMTRLTVKGGQRSDLHFWELVRINFTLRLYSLVLPKGAVMALRWGHYRKGGSGGGALALVVFERLVLFFVYVLAATVFLCLEQGRLGSHGETTLVGTALLLLLWTCALAPFFVRASALPMSRSARVLSRWLPDFAQQRIQRFAEAVIEFQTIEQRRVGLIWMVSITSYLLFVASAWALASGMGLELSLYAIAWMRPLIFIMTLVPLTVGGLGVREAGYASFMALYGVAKANGLAFGLLLFAIQVFIGSIGGIWTLLRRFQNRSQPR